MSVAERLGARISGDILIEPWGADPELVALIGPLLDVPLRIKVEGGGGLPDDGPALLVANRRFGLLEPFVLGRAVTRATGRQIRFLGIPDIAPISLPLRRLGGAVDDPQELAGLLRAGHLVAAPLGPTYRRPRRAGALKPDQVEVALELGAPVVPVAVLGGEMTGRWRVLIGQPVAVPSARTPLALAELADAARAGVQALLDEATPPRWLLG
jgi:1-acyl-sn-glycerol-3-phosphate acyltransferase